MISRADAARIAALAKLELTGDELERAARELTAILTFVEEIAVAEAGEDAGASPGTIGTAPNPGALREDVPAPSLPAGDTFANAPDADRDARLFRVPRVLGS